MLFHQSLVASIDHVNLLTPTVLYYIGASDSGIVSFSVQLKVYAVVGVVCFVSFYCPVETCKKMIHVFLDFIVLLFYLLLLLLLPLLLLKFQLV